MPNSKALRALVESLAECRPYVGAYESVHGSNVALDVMTRAQSALTAAEAHLASSTDVEGWRTMDSAPRDGTRILVFFDSESDPYYAEEKDHLTPYGAHAEGGDFLDGTGVSVAQWVDGWRESVDEYGSGYWMPGWWFAWFNGDTDLVLAPTHWRPLPESPSPEKEGRT